MGLRGHRSPADEHHVRAIAAANPTRPVVVIVDARPRLNAVTNRALGGAGYEQVEHYSGAALEAHQRREQGKQAAAAQGPSRFFCGATFHALGAESGGHRPAQGPSAPQIRSQRICSWGS